MKEECGTTENGYDDLIYQLIKIFRENKDYRYIFSEYVLFETLYSIVMKINQMIGKQIC